MPGRPFSLFFHTKFTAIVAALCIGSMARTRAFCHGDWSWPESDSRFDIHTLCQCTPAKEYMPSLGLPWSSLPAWEHLALKIRKPADSLHHPLLPKVLIAWMGVASLDHSTDVGGGVARRGGVSNHGHRFESDEGPMLSLYFGDLNVYCTAADLALQ